MADEIQRTIYKLEIDDSAYIKGIDSLTASTQKFSQAQDAANKKLAEAKIALKAASDAVLRQQQELDNANKGTNTGIIKQRQDALKSAQVEQQKLTDLVKQTEIEYQKATKLATEFANSTAKVGQGRIPLPPVTPQQIPQLIPPGGTGLGEAVGASAAEFEQLRGAIAAAELALSEMNQESEEFKALAPAVEAGKKALADYDAAAQSAGESTVSLRTQIRQGREELVKLEQQGKANTKEYRELELRVASLTDAYGDQQQRIKTLASDTKALDFGKEAITAATAAFSAYTSVSILAGDENEELQKKTLQLFAAMQLLQSLEQLSNLTRRESKIATLAQSAATGIYEAVISSTTGALKAFRIALLTTGVGVIIISLGLLVAKFLELKKEQEEAAKNQKALNDAIKSSEYSDAIKNVQDLRISINLAKDGFLKKKDVVEQYNKTIGETTGHVKTLDQAEQELNKNADAYIQFTLLKAAANIALGESANAVVALEKKRREDSLKDVTEGSADFIDAQKKAAANPEFKRLTEEGNAFLFKAGTKADATKEEKKIAEQNRQSAANIFAQRDAILQKFVEGERNTSLKEEIKTTTEIAAELKRRAAEIAKAFGFNFFQTEGGKQGKAIENVFKEENDRLLAKIADLRVQQQDGIKQINDQFAAKLIVEQNRIAGLLKDKKLTQPQADILLDIAFDVNTAELEKALADFNKKVLDAREKLNDDLRKLEQQTTEDTLNLIQDEFERRKQLIDFNEQQELADQKEFTDDRLKALDLDRLLIGEETYQRVRAAIIANGEQAATNIVQKAAQQRVQLAIDSFQKIIENADRAISDSKLTIDKGALEEIQVLVASFQAGTISYEKYKKELLYIQEKYDNQQTENAIAVLDKEIADLKHKRDTILDLTGDQYDALVKLIKEKEAEVTAARTGQAKGTVKDPDNKNKFDEIKGYADAIGQLTDSVIKFWQDANEAESAALDRSISLQEKRVDAAIRIAERGNAAYLKQEEDRLKELQIQKENAARKELAINAALQASQLLVAITGAVAKIADPVTGPAEVIGSIAIIVSSLAAGYALVKSLQNNQPKFAKGDPYVKRNGHPSGVDTIPAWLNEGEAVIPTETNKKYHPAIRAIYDEKIPAEDINAFVKNYHAVKGVPRVNYDRIKESAELSTTHDGRMSVALSEQNKLIMENNELQRMTLRAMKNMAVSATIDRDGVAISVNEYIAQMNLNKKI